MANKNDRFSLAKLSDTEITTRFCAEIFKQAKMLPRTARTIALTASPWKNLMFMLYYGLGMGGQCFFRAAICGPHESLLSPLPPAAIIEPAKDDNTEKEQVVEMGRTTHSQVLITSLLKSSIREDKFSWLRDDEFARQSLPGVNPISVEKLKVFPPVSQLNPKIYGLCFLCKKLCRKHKVKRSIKVSKYQSNKLGDIPPNEYYSNIGQQITEEQDPKRWRWLL
ncbi:linoleate 13S-lipoxygenase 3-1, chloroplastic-like protein [Tanacetum coccineum]